MCIWGQLIQIWSQFCLQSWLGRPEQKSRIEEYWVYHSYTIITVWFSIWYSISIIIFYYIKFTYSVHVYTLAQWLRIYIYIMHIDYVYIYIYTRTFMIHVYISCIYIIIFRYVLQLAAFREVPSVYTAPDRYASRMPSRVSWTENQVGFHLGFEVTRWELTEVWIQIYGVWDWSHQTH